MSMTKTGTVVLVIALIVIIPTGLAGFGGLFSSAESVKPTGQVKSFTLVAKEWGYNGTIGGPTIIVQKGDLVRITLIVPGAVSHNLYIEGYHITVGGEFGLRNGENSTVEFLATMGGKFPFYCDPKIFPGHRGLGKEGLLVVVT